MTDRKCTSVVCMLQSVFVQKKKARRERLLKIAMAKQQNYTRLGPFLHATQMLLYTLLRFQSSQQQKVKHSHDGHTMRTMRTHCVHRNE